VQQNEYYRIGSDVLHKSDARIIAASNGNFQQLLASGAFRSDLYYRISAHMLQIPPLRERREDIIPLVEHYVKLYSKLMNRPAPEMTRELRQALIAYDFPGNVRELINKVNNAVTYNRTGILGLDEFLGLELERSTIKDVVRKIGVDQFALHGIFNGFPTIDTVEAFLVEEAIALSQGNRSAAAKMLGVSRPTLQKKLEQAADRR